MESPGYQTHPKFLPYKVYKWSSFSANYSPENILKDQPTEQSSRWSSETNFLPQFIMLKLHAPAIVRSITFGKYDKDHVCNLKKFKVYGGLEESNMIEVLQDGLKNDHVPETFTLKCKMEKDQFFPCRFIKIAPILSWGPSYNFSIWFVELHGHQSGEMVQRSISWYYKYREREAIRLCLKHFREHNYMDAFSTLERMTEVELECDLVSNLHHQLVQDGNFINSEHLVEKAARDNLFSNYIDDQDYQANWSPVCYSDESFKPGMRGGHQMCIDHINDDIYVFGGWSGNEDLADFWRYSCSTNEWKCLSKDTTDCGGPSPRSCHKMCIDCNSGLIYTLGRYLDSNKRTVDSLNNELHVYSIRSEHWTLLNSDVFKFGGGPKLIFDHQMCYDDEKNTIYVFGGRVLTANNTDANNRATTGGASDERTVTEFSGLYAYNVITGVWVLICGDSGNAGPQDIRSRIGHSMLLDTKQRRLYIFGGQRLKEDVNDFLYYDIDNNVVVVLSDGSSKDSSIPPPGFTQRATIDCELGEIYMLSGLSKDRNKREENMHNSFWVYNMKTNKWRCVYKNDQIGIQRGGSSGGAVGDNYNLMFPSQGRNKLTSSNSNEVTSLASTSSSKKMEGVKRKEYKKDVSQQPCPRYAHQLVYDPIKKVHYMFGGNPGKGSQPQLRLDDFWRLRLTRPQENDVLKKCRYLLRRQRYNEMTSSDPIAALTYLSSQVYATVEHECEREARRYRHLAARLFGHKGKHLKDSGDSDSDDQAIDNFVSRTLVTNNLLHPPSSSHNMTSSSRDDVSTIVRANRTAVFNKLMGYFNEDKRQPNQNIIDLVPL